MQTPWGFEVGLTGEMEACKNLYYYRGEIRRLVYCGGLDVDKRVRNH